jgi:hypothetical protein
VPTHRSRYVEFSVAFFWTDIRLIGWPENEADDLPDWLWGPDLELAGTLGEVTEEGREFCLRDAKVGRLMRLRTYKGMVAQHWKNLKEDFPFDRDQVDVIMYTNSHYVAYNEDKEGAIPRGKSYKLRHVQPDARGRWTEGRWLNLWWEGEVAEWKIEGISTELNEEGAQLNGIETTNIFLSFHVRGAFKKHNNHSDVSFSLLFLCSIHEFRPNTIIFVPAQMSRKFGYYLSKLLFPM